jgi:hypothetical protein
MTMRRVEIVWESLERETSSGSGLLYRRLSASVKTDVYVALKTPEKLRCIAVHLNRTLEVDVVGWNKFRDIKVELFPDLHTPSKQFILILLLEGRHKDIFSSLCEDLIYKVADITDENDLVAELLIRLEKWRLLFEKLGAQGLSEEAQLGLYGELYFLRKYLLHCENFEFCVNSWKGPEKAVQDFQGRGWAVEVKTTHGKNHQKINISSERQLDSVNTPTIILCHYSLDRRENNGETLNDVVDDLHNILQSRVFAYNEFLVKLLDANYFPNHRGLYQTTGYTIREENIYRVTEDFPRIVESQIAPGVGDVRYSIIVSSDKWSIAEEQLFELILS